MPTRRSDRGRVLAKMLRENGPMVQATMEMTEPYGTISSVANVLRGNGGALDYLSAVPLIGGPARAAKKAKKLRQAERAPEELVFRPDYNDANRIFNVQVKYLMEDMEKLPKEEAMKELDRMISVGSEEAEAVKKLLQMR